MSVIKIKDDNGIWVPIDSVIKPAPVPILINTATYNIPASGGEFWVDLAAAGSNGNLVLPLDPVNNTLVSLQIVDNTIRDLFVRATTGNFLAFQAAEAVGRYAGASRNLVEVFRFFNGRWLQFYNRYTYQ